MKKVALLALLLVSHPVLAAKTTTSSTVQFSAAAYTVDETAGTITIAVTRSSSSGPLTVNYATSDGTAQASQDYEAASGTLSWASGDASVKSFTVPVINDGIVENDEAFYVTLSNPSRGTLGTPSTATITIKSDDSYGILQFDADAFSVAEGGGQAVITVRRVGGRAGAVGVSYSMSDGTARQGKDYQAVSGRLDWADGDDAPKSFVVPIYDDNVSEPDETVNLALNYVYGSATLGNPRNAVLTIVNDDLAGALRFYRLSNFANEAAGSATVTVLREYGSEGTVSVSYESADGSALAGLDYTPVSGTLVWGPGDTSPRTITLPLIADTLAEHRETAMIVVHDPMGGAAISGSSSALVLIEDSNRPSGFVLDSSGGNGGRASGTGGAPGEIQLTKSGGTGPTEILASGALDASFTPSANAPDLGAKPLVITQDTIIPVVDTYEPEPPAGTPYTYTFTLGLYISDGDGVKAEEEERVTGFSVAPGVTLTFALNNPTSYLWLQFTADVVNQGAISVGDMSLSGRRGELRLDPKNYYATGMIDTAARKPGQNGGAVSITAADSIYNYGSILTFGGDSTIEDGGAGGGVTFQAAGTIENTGNFFTYGGTSYVSLGGNAGGVRMSAAHGLAHAADASSRGGDGVTGGGFGGGFTFENRQSGEIRVTGRVDGSGGAAISGPGGTGGSSNVIARGSAVRFAGNVDARGGDTASSVANAGNGGYFNLSGWFYDGGTPYTNTPDDDTPAGDVYLAGDVLTGGGSTPHNGAGSGGSGGWITINLNTQGHPLTQRLSFVGFGQVKAEGGDGGTGGSHGSGDAIVINNQSGYDWATSAYTRGGIVRNQVSISTRGGNVYADATGGTGRGGNAGDLKLSGDTGIENAGFIDARGGNDGGTPGDSSATGGNGGWIGIDGVWGSVVNAGPINASGGDGRMKGGAGMNVYLHGQGANNSGNLTVNGGNADPSLGGSIGGNGGVMRFDIPSPYGQTGTLSVKGGTGATPGSDGWVFLY